MCVVKTARGLVERYASQHELANTLDEHECRVPLVRMPRRGLDAHGAQHPHATNPEDPFLAQAKIGATRVQLTREVTILRIVLVEVRVEEIHRHSTDHHAPRADVNVAAVCVHDRQPRLLPCAEHLLERSARGIELLVRVFLPPVETQMLVEVALRVEETDPHERNPQIRCRLAMVSREHAESTGVDRYGVVQPELGAEIRDRPIDDVRVMVGKPGILVGALAVDLPHEPIVQLEEFRISRDGTQALGMDAPQQHDRIVPGEVPQRLVDRGKERSCAATPTPRNVHCQRRETFDPRRQVRDSSSASHWQIG